MVLETTRFFIKMKIWKHRFRKYMPPSCIFYSLNSAVLYIQISEKRYCRFSSKIFWLSFFSLCYWKVKETFLAKILQASGIFYKVKSINGFIQRVIGNALFCKPCFILCLVLLTIQMRFKFYGIGLWIPIVFRKMFHITVCHLFFFLSLSINIMAVFIMQSGPK